MKTLRLLLRALVAALPVAACEASSGSRSAGATNSPVLAIAVEAFMVCRPPAADAGPQGMAA